jgi:hypothetical protein
MKICYTKMTDLLHFIVDVRKSDSNLIALCNSCAEVAGFASESISLCRQQHKIKFERAAHLSFVNCARHPTIQTKV